MRLEDFTKQASGQIVTTASGNPAFLPNPLPPTIDWESGGLMHAIVTAAEAVATLSRAAGDMSSPMLVDSISHMLANTEAKISSQIEGIHTTTLNLLLAQEEEEDVEPSEPHSRAAQVEVINYLEAIRFGMEVLADPVGVPLCNRLVKALHQKLLSGVVRGGNKNPGHFRVHQNAIGKDNDTEAGALYVPPPPALMVAAMDDLEKYIHSESARRVSAYVRAAFVHYQFEAIHPFMDGNGRVGRLLIILMLFDSGKLRQPLIYPSEYFEEHKEQYYALLYGVSTAGDWEAWLSFFFRAIKTQAEEAISRIEAITSLHEEYKAKYQARNVKGKLLQLVDTLFSHPVISAKSAERLLSVSAQTAYRYIDTLVEDGVLTPIFPERKRYQYFYAHQVMRCIEDEAVI